MTPLIFEIALRLAKVAAAAVVGLLVFAVALVAGAEPSAELALLAWLSGAAFILLVETSPI
jgi:hypothetical protein